MKLLLLSISLLMSAFTLSQEMKNLGPLSNQSLEFALTNTNFTEGNHDKARGIYVGLSLPAVILDTGNASLAMDLGFGNLGTVEAETDLGDPNDVIIKSYHLGGRLNYQPVDAFNFYLKGSAAYVDLDSSAFGDSYQWEPQAGLGVEWFGLPLGVSLSLSYMNLNEDMDLLMFGLNLR